MHHRLLIIIQSKSPASNPTIQIVYYNTREDMLKAYEKINYHGGSENFWMNVKMLDFPKED